MPGASSLAPALAGFCGAPLAEFVGAVDRFLEVSSFGHFTGTVRRYPGGAENAIILATLSREMLK